MTEKLNHKTFSQPPKPEILYQYLAKNFPGGISIRPMKQIFADTGYIIV